MKRLLKHLCTGPGRARRVFPERVMRDIEAVIRTAELMHSGEIRFAVEAALDIGPLLRGQSARARALDVFSRLRVWDTEHNNGVLIYLLLADHDVEIVADRAIHVRVGDDGWQQICAEMEILFRLGGFPEGVIAGIKAVSGHLSEHYPVAGVNDNELPDTPVVL